MSVNWSGIVTNAQGVVKKHSPEILVAVGIVGMVSTAVMVGKETPKALILLEDKKRELERDELTKMEIFRAIWPVYIPAALTCSLSIACIIGASAVSYKRNAALATAYTLSESAIKEYRAKVIETVGEKKEKEVRGNIAKDRVERNPEVNNISEVMDNGLYPCVDYHTGNEFKGNDSTIQKAVNELNKMINAYDYASLNDALEILGAETGGLGKSVGWRRDMLTREMVTFVTHSSINSKGVPCKVVELVPAPTYGFQSYM